MMRYDFRRNRQFWFSTEEIVADPILSWVASRTQTSEGSLEVTADSSQEALDSLFPDTPETPMVEFIPTPWDSWLSVNDLYNPNRSSYELLPETVW